MPSSEDAAACLPQLLARRERGGSDGGGGAANAAGRSARLWGGVAAPASDWRLWRRTALEAACVGHSGCVNHCSFDEAGELLVSGSDDTRLCIFDAVAGPLTVRRPRATLPTGHRGNIFCARWLPGGSGRIASCSADGTVRVTDVGGGGGAGGDGGGGETRIVFEHAERAKKLEVEPGNPHLLLSCSEDGTSE